MGEREGKGMRKGKEKEESGKENSFRERIGEKRGTREKRRRREDSIRGGR